MRSALDQRGHEAVVPGGRFALALEARLRGVGAGRVQSDLAQERQIARRGALAHPARILAETNVEHPMQPVLDRPMAADGRCELLRRLLAAREAVAGLGRDPA